MKPEDLCDKVVDEESFLCFVRALAADREEAVRLEKEHPASPYGPDAGGWENITIETFLIAMAQWAEDSDFGRRMAFKELELPDGSPWRRIAVAMMAGKIYE